MYSACRVSIGIKQIYPSVSMRAQRAGARAVFSEVLFWAISISFLSPDCL